MENNVNENELDKTEGVPEEVNSEDTQKDSASALSNESNAESENKDSTAVSTDKPDEVNSISSDLIRGHINTIILRALYERDKYGYEIIDDIEAKSHGQYTLKQPTLYSALKRLENQGYIKAYWKTDEVSAGGRRKYFTLTENGKIITEKNLSEWEYSRTIIDSLISDRSFDFSNPAPTPVDFKLLRDSVSRVPIVRSDESGRTESEQADSEQKEQTENKPEQLTPQQIVAEQKTETVESVECVQTVQYVQHSDLIEDKQDKEDKAENASEKSEDNKPDEQQLQQASVGQQTSEQQTAEQQISTEQQTTENVIEEQPATVVPQQDQTAATAPQYTQGHPTQEVTPQYTQEQSTQEVAPQYTQEQSNTYTQQIIQDRQVIENTVVEQPAPPVQPVQHQEESEQARRIAQAEEEARRRTHENYLKLISEPVRTKPAEDIVPGSDDIDSDKLIYNNRPETERDYKNLIDGIFYKTVANGSVQTTYHAKNSDSSQRKQRQQVTNSHLVERGRADGVSITPSNEGNSSHATRTTYNKGLTLLKSSAIVLAILAIEAILCFAFMKDLGVNWVYPTVILAIGVAQFTVFGILTLNGYGRNSVRPTSNSYISTCIILTIIGILIIAMLSFLLNMNASLVSDLMKMLVIPSITALNITVFALCFKLFLK